jgi:hypothetical protein
MNTENAPRKGKKSVSNDDLKGGESGGQDAGGAQGGSTPNGGGAPSGGAPAGVRPGGMPAGGQAAGQRPAGAPTPAAGTVPAQQPGIAPVPVTAPDTAVAVQPAEVTGNWQGKMGEFDMNLNLQAEGDKLTGTMMTPMGAKPIADGKITGHEFSFNLDIMGSAVPHKGKIDGDTITLSSNFQGQERLGTLTRVK